MIRPAAHMEGVTYSSPNKRQKTHPSIGLSDLPQELIMSMITQSWKGLWKLEPHNNFYKHISCYMTVSKIWQKSIEQIQLKEINEDKGAHSFYCFMSACAIASFVKKYAFHIKYFSFNAISPKTTVYDKEIVNLLEICPNIELIDLTSIPITSGYGFKCIFPKVRSLILGRRTYYSYRDLASLSFPFCSITHLSLNKATISGVEFFDAIEKYFPYLTSLKIEMMHDYFALELDIDNFDKPRFYRDSWFEENFCILNKIEYLDLSNQGRFDKHLKGILKHFPKLKSLNLSDNEITGEGLIAMRTAKNGHFAPYLTLESLNFNGCDLSLEGLKEITQVFPHLCLLDVSYGRNACQHISDEGLQLLASLKGLKKLYIKRELGLEDSEDDIQADIDLCCQLFAHLELLVLTISWYNIFIENGKVTYKEER